jgi:hypothetical protein
MKVGLFDRKLNALRHFVSRDETRPMLTAVHITEKVAVATDSYKLAICELPKDDMQPMDFPVVAEQKPVAEVEGGSMNVEGRGFFAALGAIVKGRRASLPILDRLACTGATDTRVLLATTDLYHGQVHEVERVQGTFPDYRKLMPTDDPLGIMHFDPQLLEQVAKGFREFGCATIQAEFRGALKPAVFKGESDGRKMVAALMPVRSDHDIA